MREKEMDSILVSVIIPIYNGEKYIKECVDKLEDHRENIEIILVNDGSQDKSSEICKMMAEKYCNVRVIEQKNSGVSRARNTGLQAATGTWVTFVDVDDFLDPKIFQDAKAFLEMNSVELIHFGSTTDYYVSDVLEKSVPRNMSTLIKDTDAYQEYPVTACFAELFKNNVFDSVWGKFFRRNTVIENGIYFRIGMKVREDSEFVLQYVEKIETVGVLNVFRYHYRVNGEEMTYYLRREISLDDIKKLQNKYYESLNRVVEKECAKALIDKHLFILIMAGIMHMASKKYGSSFWKLKYYVRDAGERFREVFCSVKQTSWFYKIITILMRYRAYVACSIVCKLRFMRTLD